MKGRTVPRGGASLEPVSKPKSLTELGAEGMLDGLDEQRRQVLLHEVPAIPRMVLLYGFAPSYRRHAKALWDVPAGAR